MRGVVMNAPGDFRVEEREDPKILKPTDAIIRVAAACVCGSDLWPYRGAEPFEARSPIGHEYVGVVEEIGSDVTTIEPGQFVVGTGWFQGVHQHHVRSIPDRGGPRRRLRGFGVVALRPVCAQVGPTSPRSRR